jgi:hypothetical protein
MSDRETLPELQVDVDQIELEVLRIQVANVRKLVDHLNASGAPLTACMIELALEKESI